jgi:hypothetical protein
MTVGEGAAMNNSYSTLKNLALLREGRRSRVSSHDRTGGNNDFVRIDPGQAYPVADIQGAGCITHIWMTCNELMWGKTQVFLRQVLLRMYWDGERLPSVEVPLGDFFGMGHGTTVNFSSAALSMSPEDGRSLNCFFAMPFADGARIEVLNEFNKTVKLYFYVDYESYDTLSERYLRFHAQWRRRNPCPGIDPGGMSNEQFLHGGRNTTGSGNYVILEAEGAGHYVGCHLDIHNLRVTPEWNWYGEGDDMIFIDGDVWPPSLHGTGTEDYFNTAWCPTQAVCTPYHGIILAGDRNWAGKISLYRYHIEDPVMFRTSIRVTIEHGHNNHRSDDYSSTAYWYQSEPHKAFPALPPPQERLPLPDFLPQNKTELLKYLDFGER